MTDPTPLRLRVRSHDNPELLAAIADNDKILLAIRKDHTYPTGSDLQSQEPSRSELRSKLEYLTSNFWVYDYRARTWGYTILRTAYRDGDNVKFQHGIDVINAFARLWSDDEVSYAGYEMQQSRLAYEMRRHWPEGMPTTPSTALNELFLSRFVNDIVEDEEALDSAAIPQVCEYFKVWALAHWDENPALISCVSPRLKSCIVLDAETLDQLHSLSLQQMSLEQYHTLGRQFWVKMAESYPQPRLVGIADSYRLKLADLVDFWFSRDRRSPSVSTGSRASTAAQLGEGNGEEEVVYVWNEFSEPTGWI